MIAIVNNCGPDFALQPSIKPRRASKAMNIDLQSNSRPRVVGKWYGGLIKLSKLWILADKVRLWRAGFFPDMQTLIFSPLEKANKSCQRKSYSCPESLFRGTSCRRGTRLSVLDWMLRNEFIWAHKIRAKGNRSASRLICLIHCFICSYSRIPNAHLLCIYIKRSGLINKWIWCCEMLVARGFPSIPNGDLSSSTWSRGAPRARNNLSQEDAIENN